MQGLRLLLNVLWIVFGGIWMAAGWALAAAVLAVTIVGLPWARAALNIAFYTLLPFGHRVVPRERLTGREDLGTGPLGFVGNVIWFVLAGWWLAIGHLITAAGLALTIVGLPFAWAHFKLAGGQNGRAGGGPRAGAGGIPGATLTREGLQPPGGLYTSGHGGVPIRASLNASLFKRGPI